MVKIWELIQVAIWQFLSLNTGGSARIADQLLIDVEKITIPRKRVERNCDASKTLSDFRKNVIGAA